MLHIGMASGRKFYSIERRGHRDGYIVKDVDGKIPSEESKQDWEGLPKELMTDLDVDDIWRRWRTTLPVSPIHVQKRPVRLISLSIAISGFPKARVTTLVILYTSPV